MSKPTHISEYVDKQMNRIRKRNVMRKKLEAKYGKNVHLKLLTNKDSFIRQRIIDQNLAYLNTRLEQYLGAVGLPHTVVFQNDLSVEIKELGRDLDSWLTSGFSICGVDVTSVTLLTLVCVTLFTRFGAVVVTFLTLALGVDFLMGVDAVLAVLVAEVRLRVAM